MNNIKKVIGFSSLPVVVIITAYILLINITNLSETLPLILQYTSYIFFMLGMLLGLRFNKSRVFFLCLAIGISQLLLSNDLPIFSAAKNEADLSDIISLLIPINLFLFSISRERGIFTVWGQFKFGFLITQMFIIWRLVQPQNSELRSLISQKLLDLNFIDIIPIPQISVLLFAYVLLFLCVRFYLKPSLFDSSSIGVIILIFAGLLVKDHFLGINIFYSMAGLILVVSILEISYSMAYRDELTGLPSRRALKESLLKLSGKYSIAMLDIDFFKKFNDTYGHDTGDKVLQMVASSLTRLDGGGKAFRFGGEEFTVLFANKTKDEAAISLDELRENISKQKFTYKTKRKVQGKEKIIAKQLGVTISIGLAEKSDKFKNAEEVMKAADKALYKSKKNGRNCLSK